MGSRQAEQMLAGWNYAHPEEIWEEMRRVTPDFWGITYERLEREGGVHWPCPALDHPGTPYLFAEDFPSGRGKFWPVEYGTESELPDAEYPFVLSTGRVLYHWHGGTMTRVSALDAIWPECTVELHPHDAARLGLDTGDWVDLHSRRGTITARLLVTGRSPEGMVFIPFHFAEAAANVLTDNRLDARAKIPDYKVCGVRVSRAAPQADRPGAAGELTDQGPSKIRFWCNFPPKSVQKSVSLSFNEAKADASGAAALFRGHADCHRTISMVPGEDSDSMTHRSSLCHAAPSGRWENDGANQAFPLAARLFEPGCQRHGRCGAGSLRAAYQQRWSRPARQQHRPVGLPGLAHRLVLRHGPAHAGSVSRRTSQHLRLLYPGSGQPGRGDDERLQDGTAPDVLAGCCDFFPAWAQSGHLLDLRPYVEADLERATIDDWDAAQYKALFTADGVQFGLPKYHGALALYYNIDLFDRYDVDRPDGSWNHERLPESHGPDHVGPRPAGASCDQWASMLDISLGAHPGSRQRLGRPLRRSRGLHPQLDGQP